ncbi:hypothetical protein BBK36DRAFT_21402 [Trichoderma citrinoviride]|uniref:BZIP domain-containing protein n=1 Tax=Trichoderma citrinoviride TaxID=58853 RepID=A0A2T4B5S6_9HYPO|nr:hypothetical protein BBK36DRAFT_21402 [Trichoderma citrinoviride]PTB64650.1 hypothetical protein BBK36DRAFT_21402 [Trichoderma citrinoviride]
MDSHNVMAALIDPRLQMMDPGTTAGNMHYPLPTSFGSWSSLFEDFPPLVQDMGMMETEFQSDSASLVSPLRKTEHDFGSPLSPLEDILDMDESPGNTSIFAGLSEGGTSGTEKKAPKTTTNTKGRKGRRRRCSETEKRDMIKQRNRVAASKCRQKKKEKVDELKEIKAALEARNTDLHLEYQRLRQELGQVKSHLIHHTDCNDPNIDRWVESEAKGYVQKLVRNSEQRRLNSIGSVSSIGSSDSVVDGIRMHSLQTTVMPSEDAYMG